MSIVIKAVNQEVPKKLMEFKQKYQIDIVNLIEEIFPLPNSSISNALKQVKNKKQDTKQSKMIINIKNAELNDYFMKLYLDVYSNNCLIKYRILVDCMEQTLLIAKDLDKINTIGYQYNIAGRVFLTKAILRSRGLDDTVTIKKNYTNYGYKGLVFKEASDKYDMRLLEFINSNFESVIKFGIEIDDMEYGVEYNNYNLVDRMEERIIQNLLIHRDQITNEEDLYAIVDIVINSFRKAYGINFKYHLHVNTKAIDTKKQK